MSRLNFKFETTTLKTLEHKALLKSNGITMISSSQTRTQKFIHFSVNKSVDKDWIKEKLQSLNIQEI